MRSALPVTAWVAVALVAGVTWTHGCSASDSGGAEAGQGGAPGTAGKGGSKAGTGGSAPAGSAGSGLAGGAGSGGSASGSGGGSGDRKVIGGDCAPIDPGNAILDSTWVQFSQFGCDCSFLISTAESVLPPIEWEPCKDITAVACEQMKPDPRMTDGRTRAYPHSFFLRGDGSFDLVVSRYGKTASYYAYAGIDGQLSKGMTTCISPNASMKSAAPWINDGVFSIAVVPVVAGTEHGLVAGRVSDELPSLVRRLPDVGTRSSDWAASPSWVVRTVTDVISVGAWDSQETTEVYTPSDDPDGLPGHVSDVRGDAVFLNVLGGQKSGQMVWRKDGLRPLIRYYGDADRVVLRWGSDGKDMVWLYGEGELVSPYVHKTMVVKTAPYSLDASTIEKSERVIGPNPVEAGGLADQFKVGCGYAATLASSVDTNGPAIVRLSDGVWWKIRPDSVPYTSYAMGVSCEHAYFAAPDGTPIRIPLSSLPPGGMAGW